MTSPPEPSPVVPAADTAPTTWPCTPPSTRPSDAQTLATAVADSLVVASDAAARTASIFYWDRGRSYTRAVVEAVHDVESATVRDRCRQLLGDSTSPETYYGVRRAVTAAWAGGPAPGLVSLVDLAWQAECNSRLGFHLGPDYDDPAAPPVGCAAQRPLPPGRPLPDDVRTPVLVVVPFRDQNHDTAPRLRNLIACLLSLRDQSVPRETYRVVVVESDATPRWADVIAPHADHYVFAPRAGRFNKSWAVNVGVVNAPHPAELVCILDADVLADRGFVARNIARFTRPGRMGHITYRDMWCLDQAATSWSIQERLFRGAAAVSRSRLRAFVLRRPPGCCVWVRRSAFDRVGGMDERFEGWGGEDNDFAYRMDVNSAFDSYDDDLLHLYHPASATLRDDGNIHNVDIPALSWPPDSVIGRVGRFAGQAPTTGPPLGRAHD